jgi:uncharacterized protein
MSLPTLVSASLAVIIGLGLPAPSSAAPQQPQVQVPEVVTSGEAVVRRAPDRAFITVTTESRARSPRDAQQENARMMTAVQDKLRSARVPREAIRTLGYTVEPEFDFTNNRRTLRDYVARNTIEVRMDDLDRLGETLDAAVNAGATSVGDVRFDLKDRETAEREALRLAVADARARADAAAAGAGRTVDHIIRIQENGTEPIEPPRPALMAMRAGSAAPETPIAAGDIEIRARVTLTAALK